MKFTSSRDGESISLREIYFQSYIRLKLSREPIQKISRCDLFSITTHKWTIIHQEIHRQRRLIDMDRWHSFRSVHTDRLTDEDIAHTRDRDYITGDRFLFLDSCETECREDFRYFAFPRLAIITNNHYLLTSSQSPCIDTTDTKSSQIVIITEIHYL